MAWQSGFVTERVCKTIVQWCLVIIIAGFTLARLVISHKDTKDSEFHKDSSCTLVFLVSLWQKRLRTHGFENRYKPGNSPIEAAMRGKGLTDG
jgi:hypothetical protein